MDVTIVATTAWLHAEGVHMRTMQDARRSCATATFVGTGVSALLLSMAPGVLAQDTAWVSVAKGDRTEVFLKTTSLQWSGAWLTARTRQEFFEPQAAAKQGKTFLSARNDYRIDCAQRRLAYHEIRAYAEAGLQGDVVQKTKIGDKNLKWMDAPAGTVFGELLDYACDNAPAAAAAPAR
jgi:hypothetical protein